MKTQPLSSCCKASVIVPKETEGLFTCSKCRNICTINASAVEGRDPKDSPRIHLPQSYLRDLAMGKKEIKSGSNFDDVEVIFMLKTLSDSTLQELLEEIAPFDDDPECEHGFLPAEDCPNKCVKKELRRIRAIINRRLSKLTQ